MMTPREVAQALYGLSRVLRMDPAAPGYFGATPSAFWNSFWVAVWVMPIYALQSAITYLREPVEGGPLFFGLVELFSYVTGWVLFPLVMVRVSDWLDRWPRYFHYLTMYNWLSLPFAIAFLPAVLLGAAGIASPLVGLYYLGIIFAVLVYGWWITVHALNVSGATAVGLVLLNNLLSLLAMRLTHGLIS